MALEIGIILSFANWLGSKIADKGFDALYKKVTNKNLIDEKFRGCIERVSIKLEKKYPDILGNSISYFFTQEDVFEELCKLLFFNQDVNIKIIEESFQTTTLPKDFIQEFIIELKDELSKEAEIGNILSNKELFITVKGISKNINEISQSSSLTLKEIKQIKKILKDRFKKEFIIDNFLKIYFKNLLTNFSYVTFIGLGLDPSIRKGKRKEIESIFVKPFFSLTSTFHSKIEENCEKKSDVEYEDYVIDEKIPYDNLFNRQYNYVILGNPGAGKSLLEKSEDIDPLKTD